MMETNALPSSVHSTPAYIFGRGRIGQLVQEDARLGGVCVRGFLESDPGGAHHPDSPGISLEDRAACLVVIAISAFNPAIPGIVSQLKSLGYRNILHYSAFLVALNPEKHHSQIDRTQRALGDTVSREILRAWLDSMESGTLLPSQVEPLRDQYFSESIPLKKGYSRFIDCGAFTGDTLEELHRRKGIIDGLALFEPDLGNAAALGTTLSKKRYAEQQILFPCAVWNRNEYLRFQTTSTAGSALSDTGNTSVLAVSIDACLPNFLPTMIKMDIEGAELVALEGARQTISECRPDLAICVYHSTHDLWRIPAYLLDLNPGYRFYLRTYERSGAETVLYATSP